MEEALFADADSIDAVPNRPNVRRSLRYLNSIQISDDEMDAVRIDVLLLSSLSFSIKIWDFFFTNSCRIKLNRQLMEIIRCRPNKIGAYVIMVDM